MKEAQRDFKQIIRTYFLRAIQIAKQKSTHAQTNELQQTFTKLVNCEQLQQAIITRVINLDLKNDYHQNLLVLLLQQLAKWSNQHYHYLKERPSAIETLISQSITLFESQEQFHTIISKKNELLASLLVIPTCIENLEYFRVLYRKLKDVKDYYPLAVRQSQKMLFSKTIEQCLGIISKNKYIKTMQFIHGNICQQIEQRWLETDILPSRLRILRKIIKYLWCEHQQISLSSAYLLFKLSEHLLDRPTIIAHVLSLYQNIMEYFIQNQSLVPLILFQHVIITNLKIAQKRKQILLIEILLEKIVQIFQSNKIKYFLKYYDWNFMSQGICQKSIQLVFNFTEDRQNEKKIEFEIYKKNLKKIILNIQKYLEKLPNQVKLQNKTFYQVKKQQYFQYIQYLNKSPKKIFKLIQSTSQTQRQLFIQKIVHIIRRSPHLQKKSMIALLTSDHAVSKQILELYLKSLMGMCKQNNLQQFLRFFISNFFLSGQSQQIQRMLDELTKFYYRNQHNEQNQTVFKNSDSAYCFANAIIILNTDLHNPKNQNKMSQQSFFKMCKGINDKQNLPQQVLKKTYSNIKNYQIHTFRDLRNLYGISYQCWLLITSDKNLSNITYYDEQFQDINNNGFQQYAKQILSSIINQKQDSKLQSMIQRFQYDDKNYQCQIIQTIRKSIDKRSHLALHMLQKVYQNANFKSNKFSQKIMSYYWLAVKIIQNFYNKIPSTKLAQLLILTVKLRMEINDHLYSRQRIQLKKIKICIKQAQKRASKKSIMDIFTNFLSKDSSDDQIRPVIYNKKMNYQGFGLTILEILEQNKQSKSDAIDFIIGYICNEEAKPFEEFMSLLSLSFYLIYTNIEITQDSQQFFKEILNLKQSKLNNRLNILKQKDPKKFNLLQSFCKYWILKISLKNFNQSIKLHYLISQCKDFIQITDQNLCISLINQTKNLKQIPQQLSKLFSTAIIRLQLQNQQIQWFKQIHLIKQETNKKQQKQIKEQNILVNVQDQKKQNQQKYEVLQAIQQKQNNSDNIGKEQHQSNLKEQKDEHKIESNDQHIEQIQLNRQTEEMKENQSLEEQQQLGLPLYML